jgi:hypothetical protein
MNIVYFVKKLSSNPIKLNWIKCKIQNSNTKSDPTFTKDEWVGFGQHAIIHGANKMGWIGKLVFYVKFFYLKFHFYIYTSRQTVPVCMIDIFFSL